MARIMGRRTLARATANLEEKVKPDKAEKPKAEKKAPAKKTSGSK